MNIHPLQFFLLLGLAGIGGGIVQTHFAKKIAPASTSASLCSMATEYEVRHVSEGSPSVRITRKFYRDGWVVQGANLDARAFPSADSAYEAYQGTLVQTDGGSRD